MRFDRQLVPSQSRAGGLTCPAFFGFFSRRLPPRCVEQRRGSGCGASSSADRRHGRLPLVYVLAAGVALASPALAALGKDGAFVPDARALWMHSLAVQRLRAVRGEAVLRTMRRSGHETRLEIRFVGKLGPDGWGRLLLSRIESGGPLRGSSFLTIERRDEAPTQWLYLPALGSPRRIAASSRGESYFGSEFAYAGLLQPRLSDFDVKLLGQEWVEEDRCWKLEAAPKGAAAEAEDDGKLVLWIRQDNAVERRVLYYDGTGRPFKLMDVRDVIPAAEDGKWMALTRRMRNLRSGALSVVTFSEIETDVDVDDVFFSPQNLSTQLW